MNNRRNASSQKDRRYNKRSSKSGNSKNSYSNKRNYGNKRNGNRNKRQQKFDSGNKRERITVESGNLVLIDQFMLANPQFTSHLNKIIDEGPDEKDALISKYGGHVVSLEPGTYRIDRNPYKMSIVVHPEGERLKRNEVTDQINEQAEASDDTVFVDTRCLAMVDRELLDDVVLIEKYQSLWFSDQAKACRDLLRDNGGAVRYGFSRESDVLTVHRLEDKNIICMLPKASDDATDSTEDSSSSEETHQEEASA